MKTDNIAITGFSHFGSPENIHKAVSSQELIDLGYPDIKILPIEKDIVSMLANRKAAKLMTRPAQLTEIAVQLALQSASLLEGREKVYDPFELGLYLGVGLIPSDLAPCVPVVSKSLDQNGAFSPTLFSSTAIESVNPLIVLKYLSGLVLSHSAQRFGIKGSNAVYNNFQIGTALAMEAALLDLMDGNINYAIVGGADDLLNFFAYSSLIKMGFLEKQDCVLTEGATFFVLEKIDHAKKRGNNIYAQIHELTISKEQPFLDSGHRIERGASQFAFNCVEPLLRNETGTREIITHSFDQTLATLKVSYGLE